MGLQVTLKVAVSRQQSAGRCAEKKVYFKHSPWRACGHVEPWFQLSLINTSSRKI